MAAAQPQTTSSRRRIFALAACCLLLPAATAAPEGKQYRVGGDDGWRLPPPESKDTFYGTWASNITFYVGDTLEFVYRNDSVLQVSKAGYYHCNWTAGHPAPRDGRATFLLDVPGDAYFATADNQRCAMGERLAITVVAAAGPPAPAPSPWSSAPGPWSWVLSPSSSAPAASSPSAQHSAAAPLGVSASSAHAAVVALALAMAAGFV